MPTQCNTKPLEFESGARFQPELDGSTISASGGQAGAARWAATFPTGGAV